MRREDYVFIGRKGHLIGESVPRVLFASKTEPKVSEQQDLDRGTLAVPQASPCEICGSALFWVDRYRQEIHCAGCYDPPSRAMVLRVLFIFTLPDGRRELRDFFQEHDDLDASKNIDGDHVQWVEDDGRIVSCVRGTGERVGPPKGSTWDSYWCGRC